jgi:hypothetical protein
MAGIDSLLKGAAESFAKETAGKILTPQQMEFAKFLLNPKFYLAEQGLNKLASSLGYGQEVKQVQADAQDEKEYFKEVMRDSIGDMLPDSIGNLIRATPMTEPNAPAGVYTSYDPATDSWNQNQSSNPVISSNPFASDLFAAANDINSVYNTNSQNYVGPTYPQDIYSGIYSSNLTDLLQMLGPYESKAIPETIITESKETAPTTETLSPIDFSGTMDYSDMFGGGDKGFEREMDFGDYDYGSYEMAKGGQIPRGKR